MKFVEFYDEYGHSHVLNLALVSHVFIDRRSAEVTMANGGKTILRSSEGERLKRLLLELNDQQ